MAKKKNLYNKFQELFTKKENEEKKFDERIEQKQQYLLEQQHQLKEKENHLKMLYKSKVLEEITEQTYKEEEAEVQKIRDAVEEVQQDITAMVKFREENTEEILQEMQDEYTARKDEELAEIRKINVKAMQAKQKYLEELAELGEEYKKVVEPRNKLELLKEKFGIQKHSYISGVSALNLVAGNTGKGTSDGVYEPIKVDAMEAEDALKGKVSDRRKDVIEKAKKDGVLK